MNKTFENRSLLIREDDFFMKKSIIVLLLIFSSYYFISSYIEDNVDIPEEAIRIRILANSNSDYDQRIKNAVKNNIQGYMYNLLKNTGNIKEAEDVINKNLDNIDKKVDDTLHALDYHFPYTVNFGLNYFPEKNYKGVNYASGYYESLLITLGEGKGDNWWCVLFPPLCLIEAEESTEVEYKSFVKELIDKYV